MPRLRILQNQEIKEFDHPPALDEKQRTMFFTLDLKVRERSEFLREETLLGFILLKGYFLAHQKILKPVKFRKDDIKYCCELLEIDSSKYVSGRTWYKKTTLLAHKKEILDYHGFKSFSDFRSDFKKEALALVDKALKPKQIFYYLVNYLIDQKIEIPDYGSFSSVITDSLNELEMGIISQLDQQLNDYDKLILDEFMMLTVGEGDPSAHNPFLLTAMKKPSHDMSNAKVQASISHFKKIADLFHHFEFVFRDIEISDALVNYYAGWMIIAEQPQFNAIVDKNKKYLFLLSLIAYQYRLHQDHFVNIFLKSTHDFTSKIDSKIKNDFLNQNLSPSKQLKESQERIVKKIKSDNGKLKKVWTILKSNQYTLHDKVNIAIEVIEHRPDLLEHINDEFLTLENTISKKMKEETFYENVESSSKVLSRKVKELFLILNFNNEASDPVIYEPAFHYQSKASNISNSAPIDFLDKEQLKYIVSRDGINTRLYKCILLLESAKHIKSGSLNLKYSNDFRSINDYMISEERWATDKEELLKSVNLYHLLDFKNVIKGLKEKLDKQYELTNKNLSENKHINFNKKGRPIIKTPKSDENNADFLDNLLSPDKVISLISVLSDVAEVTGFHNSFTHFGMKGSHKMPDKKILLAGIIGLGCNIGVRKMGKITKGINEEKLVNTIRWHFSKDNIIDAKNKIIKLIDQLSIPKYFRQAVDQMHTSSDGQKFGVSVPSVHANHSYKYLGTGEGVTAYCFIDEFSRVFYDTIISPTEREATYVLDGLIEGGEVESTIHSTDTHGYTDVLCGVCYSLGILFAPRLKNAGAMTLYTFKDSPRKKYEEKGFKILPDKSKYTDEKKLETQWDTVLRLLVSIKTKEVKASVLFKRLSSYSKNHPLYKALQELGRIHKSIFLLKYFDDAELRQQIQKQLNKGELWHKFAKDVSIANNQEFMVGAKNAQELFLSCRNLIQNAIVLWNYLTLTEKLAQLSSKESKEIIGTLNSNNMITWKHINMLGEYDFAILNNDIDGFDLNELTKFDFE